MNQFHTIALISACVSAPVATLGAKPGAPCESSMELPRQLAKLERETALPGALVQVRDEIGLFSRSERLPALSVRHFRDGDVPFSALPGSLLEIVEAPRVLYFEGRPVTLARIRLAGTAAEAEVFWTELKISTGLLREMIPARQRKPAPPRFNVKPSSDREAELNAQGLTAFERPMAEVGQKVWVANASGKMLAGNVGVLEEIRPPEPDGRRLAMVRMLNGRREPVLYLSCNPLSDEEFEVARAHWSKSFEN